VAYTIIALVILGCIFWGWFKSHPARVARNAGKPQKQLRYGYVRRSSPLGRPVIQSDEQRSEVMWANRDRYDPSLDRLDPRHEDHQDPDPQET
jgi:hypothetical protein